MKKVYIENTDRMEKLESLSVILPAFNEEDNVENAITSGYKALENFALDIEFIVVNDGSNDRTGERLDQLTQKFPFLRVIHHPVNRGYGAALRSGFEAAKKEFIFFTDSDLQFNLNEFDLLLKRIDDYDIVVGYRKKRADAFIRKLNAGCWNLLIRIVLGIKVHDIDCAFKLFRRDFFETTTLTSEGAMINTEIFALANMKQLSIKEVPVSHFERCEGEQSGANLNVIIKAFKELLSMRKKLSGSLVDA